MTGVRRFVGTMICLMLLASVLFAPSQKSLGGQNHASPEDSSIISASCNPTCSAPQPPLMIGWGGLRLDSATIGATLCTVCYKNTTFVASNVFPGQSQSDTERLLVRMKAMGLNTIKVSFANFCTRPAGDGTSDSPFNITDMQNTVRVASYYGFWIVLRYDGSNDIYTQTSCWLNYWQSVISQIDASAPYTQLIFDPINEPGCGGNPCLATQSLAILSANYQSFINMVRALGDKHFIVVENQCDQACPFSISNMYQGYPTVTDSASSVLISFHKYYGFNQWDVWTVSAAISTAQADVATTIKGMQVTGWQSLDTEGGPSMQVRTCYSGSASTCPPGTILPGSAGYSDVTLAYIQTVTSLFDSHTPRIGYVWWPIGTWTAHNTPCAGSYGSLQPAYCPGGTGYTGGVGWGNLLKYVPVNGTLSRPALSTGFSFLPTSPLFNSPVSFTAVATGGTSPYTITWNFGDGVTGSGAATTHTYTTAQSFTVTETATDSSTPTQTAIYHRLVTVFTSLRPTLTVPGNRTVTTGTWINFTVTAASANTGGSVVISATGLPTGAIFNPSTGGFSWKPSSSQTGSYTIVFVATDSSSPSTPTSKPVGIQVNEVAPGGSGGGNGGSSGGSNGSCLFCGILPRISGGIVFLVIGGLLGLIASLALLTIRARASLERTKRRMTG